MYDPEEAEFEELGVLTLFSSMIQPFTLSVFRNITPLVFVGYLKLAELEIGIPYSEPVFEVKTMTQKKVDYEGKLRNPKEIKLTPQFVKKEMKNGLGRYKMYFENQELDTLNKRLKLIKKDRGSSLSPKKYRKRVSIMKSLEVSEPTGKDVYFKKLKKSRTVLKKK